MKTIETLPDVIVKKHQWLFDAAKLCGVAICGGCAAAIVKENKDYSPKDIDLVGTEENVMSFLMAIHRFLNQRSVHYRIYGNANNDFVPPQAKSHLRIQCNYWLPICVFIIPCSDYRTYRIKNGYLLQYNTDIKKAAISLEEIDGKQREASNIEESFLEEKIDVIDKEESINMFPKRKPIDFDINLSDESWEKIFPDTTSEYKKQ